MEKQFLAGVSRKERIQMLTDNAERVELFTYPRPLDDSEMRKLKDETVQHHIELAKLEEVKKEFMADHKAEVDPLKMKVKEKLQKIRSRNEEVEEQVYLLADQEEGMMGYYNADGVLVYQRSLSPDERQFRIVDDSKTGTNN